MIDVDQSPIGRTPRSNPATYTGAFDGIRKLFARCPRRACAATRPGRFSFNVKGGRCEACQGDGLLRVEMHFLPDLFVTCEVCRGRRYDRETLEVRYKGKSIADVLEMTVEEAVGFLENVPRVRRPLADAPRRRASTTCTSASRRRRSRAARRSASSSRASSRAAPPGARSTCSTSRRRACTSPTSSGCCACSSGSSTLGNSVVVIEHHLDVVKSADWVIDLGPEGGAAGGRIVAEGTPEAIARLRASHTGRALREARCGERGGPEAPLPSPAAPRP